MPKGVYQRSVFNSHSHCHSKDLTTTFWQRVDRVNGPIHPICGRCWVWLGNPSLSYGYFKGVYAHRYVWKMLNGAIPKGMLVLHECDNGKCVNPGHLFLGTAQDNMDDKMAKGRQGDSGTKTPPVGELNNKAKLTWEQVEDIRRRHKRGRNQYDGGNTSELALEFGVSKGAIQSVVSRKTWK